MKNCTHCTYANWLRTAAGKLHPSGDGHCEYEYKLPPLPASRWWGGITPRPYGGHINRRIELKDHCTYFARKLPPTA